MSEATDETEVQDTTIDAGAAMGSAGDQSETSAVPEADRVGYDELVKRASGLVESGTTALDALEPKDYHDKDVDTFRADVRERLDDGRDTSADDETVTSVDWGDLWDEFGMDTPDSIGTRWMCRPKLKDAIQCSEQGVAGDSGGRIDDAVDAGVLQEVRAESGRLRGYVYAGGER